MRTRLRYSLVGAMAALAVAGTNLGVIQAEELKIGMITTLSGGGSSLGIDVRDGFLLAIKQAGDPEVTVLVEDDARRPDLAKQIATKFIQRDKVSVLTGIIWSNLAMAVVPFSVRQGVFFISPNAGPSALAGRGCHKNYFNVSWQNDNLPEAMGGYMQANGYKKPFIMAPNYPAGKDMMTGFKRYYKGSVAKEVYTKLGQTDYAAEISQIRAAQPDAVFFFLPGGMGVSFIKQYAQSGLKIPLLGPGFSFDQSILQAVGDAALGVKNTAQWSPDIDKPANRAFVKAFQAEYGRMPSLYASQGYDAANLILSAKAKAGSPKKSADAFRTALEAAQFASVRGSFKFARNHHPIQDIYLRQVVKEGDLLTNKVIGIAIRNHANAYVNDCRM